MSLPVITQLPDNFYKILATLALLLIVYSTYKSETLNDEFDKASDEVLKLENRVTLQEYRHEQMIKKVMYISRILSNKYGIDNPISSDSLTIGFVYRHGLTGIQEKVQDSLFRTYNAISDSITNLNASSRHLSLELDRTNTKLGNINSQIEVVDYQSTAGLVILLLSLLTLFARDEKQQKLENIKWQKENTAYEHCQSCGLTFNSMIVYGTNADRSPNNAFCSTCFDSGNFKDDISRVEMYDKTLQRLSHTSWLYRNILKNRYKSLERWRYKS